MRRRLSLGRRRKLYRERLSHVRSVNPLVLTSTNLLKRLFYSPSETSRLCFSGYLLSLMFVVAYSKSGAHDIRHYSFRLFAHSIRLYASLTSLISKMILHKNRHFYTIELCGGPLFTTGRLK